MGEQKNRWNWDIPGFEPRKPTFIDDDDQKPAPLLRRYSISAASAASAALPHSEHSRHGFASKIQKLNELVKVKQLSLVLHAREDYLDLRQEASDLQEYSNAKLDRVTRYLGVLADKARKLGKALDEYSSDEDFYLVSDHAAIEAEARISPLINEKKKLFNDLLTAKGNIKVFCRARPLFDVEGSSIVEFPDDFTIRVNTGADYVTNPKKDFEFDRVYGPHVGQGDLFHDVQPFVQSALDGYNVSVFAYGQTCAGKTHTMEGSTNERGLYVRSFEELFDLSNSDTTSTSHFNFYVTAFELYNEQVQDLLAHSGNILSKVCLGPPDSFVELVQEKVENPLDFSRVLKMGLQRRGMDISKCNVSHLVITIHIHHSNWVTRENLYSKLSLVDLAGSEGLLEEDANGERVTDLLHVMKSLSASEIVPYEHSRLTTILADSLGGSSKTLLIVNICPNSSNLSETLTTLNFATRARNSELSLGNRDTIKKWRDVANDSRKELYEKEKEIHDLKQEVLGLKQALKDANDQCILLFNEVQKAWKVSFTLQEDLKSENLMLADKQKLEKEQNAQLRNQVAQLLQLEQDQKMQIQERDSTIQALQAKCRSIELQLNEALHSNDARSPIGSESGSNGVLSKSKAAADSMDSSAVTKKLEEELLKRDAFIEMIGPPLLNVLILLIVGIIKTSHGNLERTLIGDSLLWDGDIILVVDAWPIEWARTKNLNLRLHEENEKLFDRLSEKASLGGSPQVSSPFAKGRLTLHSREPSRVESTREHSLDVLPSASIPDKNDSAVALVKSGPEKVKTTPAGEYLTSALNDFDPEQYDSLATIADGANKLLMLVLAAVIKAGAAREHEILAEIRDAVFSFIRRMEPQRVMDTMLVSRVRILYIRSLLARSPELQSIKVSPVERFLEKANTGRSRSSSRGNSPGRSPVRYDSGVRNALVDEHIHGFKVNIKQEKKSKLSSIVLKLRGIDQEIWRQHVTGGKLREITEEAKSFAVGNKALAALFVHTPAGELQRQIRSWLAENFEFLSVTGGDAIGGTTGQLELLSTAIMDGWMAGLGAAQPPSTDALGQLLSDYAKRVYTSQLQHLKDIAGTLATEDAEDSTQVNKLRSALESVDHKRRKILQQMRSDIALLTKEEGGSPIRNPSTAAEDARLASLISLDGILKQVKDITRQASQGPLTKSKKRSLLASLDELSERMPSLLDIDHPCAQRQIAESCALVETKANIAEDQYVDIHSLNYCVDMVQDL
ncbi:Kinesin-like protein KIN-14L [Asimina triloba]